MFFIYRVPSNGNKREKWIQTIEKHQQFPRNSKAFKVCIRHFAQTDYKKKGDKFTLNSSAVPSIFEAIPVVAECEEYSENCDMIIGHECVDETTKNTQCVQCPFLLDKIEELKRQIFRMKCEHSILIQKLEQTNISLKKDSSDKAKKLKTTKMELSNEKSKNIKLVDVLDEMKSKNYISDDEKDFLNVIT